MNTIHKLLKSFCVLLGVVFATVIITSSVNVDAVTSYDQIAKTAVDNYEIPGSEDPIGLSEDVWLLKYEWVTKQSKAVFKWTTDSPNLNIIEIPETDPNYSETNAKKNLLMEVIPDDNAAVDAFLTLTATFTHNGTTYTENRVFELKIAQKISLMDYDTYDNTSDGSLIKVRGYVYAKGDLTADRSYNAVILKDENSENYYYLNNVIADSSYGIGSYVEVLGLKTKTGKIGDFGLTVNAEENEKISAANKEITDISKRAPLINTVTFEASVISVKKIIVVNDEVQDISYKEKNLSDIENEGLYEVAIYKNIELVSEDSKLYFVSGNTKIEVVERQYINENLSKIIEVMNTGEVFNMKLIIVFEDGIKKVEPFGQASVEYVDADLQKCYDAIIDVVPQFADGHYNNTISNIELPKSVTTKFTWAADNKYIKFRTDGTGTTNAIIKVPSKEDVVTIVTLTSSLNGKSVSRTFTVYENVGDKEPIKAADIVFAVLIVVVIIVIIVATFVFRKLGEQAAIVRRQELAAREEKARAARSEEANNQLENLIRVNKE